VFVSLKPNEVGSRDGRLCKLDDPQRYESYVLLFAFAHGVAVEATASQSLELVHRSMLSYGARFREVRVNAVTGERRVIRISGSFDCGRILNAGTATSQFRGDIIMGLGLAPMEETRFGERNGSILNSGLAEYHVPVQMDVLNIDINSPTRTEYSRALPARLPVANGISCRRIRLRRLHQDSVGTHHARACKPRLYE
jgi:xanthine dehydrogenase YagR molybdenum-binding subunit